MLVFHEHIITFIVYLGYDIQYCAVYQLIYGLVSQLYEQENYVE